MAMNTKGGRRRAKRRAARDAKKVAKQQYVGGSEDALKDLRENAANEIAGSRADYDAAAQRLNDVGDKALAEADSAGADYTASRDRALESRQKAQASLAGIQGGADKAIAMRNAALAKNNLNDAAGTAITANEAVAAQRLSRAQGALNAQARGLAGGMGEGGSLAMQQALASAGAGSADLAAENQLNLTEAANKTRFDAAQGQVQNELGVADANAGTTYDAGINTSSASQNLYNADQAARDAATQRQGNFFAQGVSTAGAGLDSTLGNKGQELNNEQTINTAQISADQARANAVAEAARKNSGLNKFERWTAPWNNKES